MYGTQATLRIEGNAIGVAAYDGLRVPVHIAIDRRTGLISAVSEPRGSADLLLDNEDTIVPGLIDAHVHAREDTTGRHCYKETFSSAGNAALHGGVTAFAEMPNNPVPPVDADSYRAKLRLAASCPVDVLLFAALGPGTQPLPFEVPYKAYVGQSIGDLWFNSREELRKTLGRYHGCRVAFHAESPDILKAHSTASRHEQRRPPEAEVEAIEMVLRLSEENGVQPHICHLSTADGLDLVKRAKRHGQEVTCEVTPHHLFYDESNMASCWAPSFLQVNPPIRTIRDREALLGAFARGEIDYLATDHAPHSIAEKENGMSGISHLDTFGPFLFWLMANGVSLRTVVAACSTNPGAFIGRFLSQRYGQIDDGAVGSLTVLSTRPCTVRRETLRTSSAWSPFEGETFGGSVRFTVVRGEVHSNTVS